MDYCFHMAVTGWNDKVHKDMKRLTEEEGINSYKFFMAYKGALMVRVQLSVPRPPLAARASLFAASGGR